MCGKNYLLTAITLLCSLLALPSASLSQQKETVQKTFSITYIYSDPGKASLTKDTTLVYFPATNKSGVEVGASGTVITKDDNGYYSREAGRYFVYSVDSSGTWGYVIASREFLNGGDSITVGDLITLDIKIPKRTRENIFLDLDLLGVNFYKRDDQRLWNFETLLEKKDNRYFDTLVKLCVAELKSSYERELADPDSVHLVKRNTGRYAGQSAVDILKNANARTVLPFLTYAKDKSSWFKGSRYYFDWVLKWWLRNDAPYSYTEMLDTLLSYNINSTKFKSFLLQQKEAILDGNFVNQWAFIAMDKQTEQQERKADSILLITNAASQVLNDDYSKGLHFLAQAQIFQYRSKYDKALAACDSSLKYLTARRNGHYHSELHMKKAYLFQQLNRIKDAEAAYDLAAAVAYDTLNNLEGDTREYMLGRVLSRKGNMYKSIDEYAKAISTYKESISNYIKDKGYTSLTKAADVQSDLAAVYKKQGAYKDAFTAYSDLKSTYTRLTDVKNIASTSNSIGYVLFKQGQYRESIENHKKAEQLYTALKFYSDAAYSYSSMGQAYWNLGNYDSAILCHNLALSNGKHAEDNSRIAYSWSKLAELYSLIGEKSKSLAAYDSSSLAYEMDKDSVGLVENLLAVGSVYKTDKQYQKATEYFKRVLKISLQQQNKSSIIDAYFKIGDAAYYFDTAVSRINYEACYNLAKQIDDKSNLLYAALNLGVLASRRFDYRTSDRYFREGLQMAIDQKSISDEAWAYARIADGANQRLEYDTAISLYKRALDLYTSVDDRSQIPLMYASMAYSVGCKGDLNGSLAYYEKTKQLGYESKNLSNVAAALSSMSFIYSLFGEHAKALSCVDSALHIFQSLENQWQIANTYMTMGSVYSGMGDFNKAVTYHMKADSLFRLEKDELSRSITQNNIGVVYFFQADYDRSLSYFVEADKLAKVQNTVNESMLITRQNIGEIYLAKKQYDLATKYLSEVNKISREKNLKRTLGGSSLLLGKIEFEKRNTAEALKYFQEAKTNSLLTNETDRLIESELFLSKTYTLANDPKNITHLRTAVTLAQKTGSKYLWEVLYELGITLYNQNQFDSAITYFKDAVTEIDNGASKLFGGAEAKKVYAADERKVDLYNKLVASLAKLKRTDEALFYADKSNSQAIKEKLERSGIVTADKDKNEALKKGGELLQKQTAIEQAIAKERAKPVQERNEQLIASLEGVKKVAEEDYLNFINQLVVKYPDLNSYFSKTDPSQFRNFIDYIPDSTIVVLYVINDKQLFIFTVTNQETGIKVVELPEDLNAKATKFLNIVKNPENATGTGVITVRATVKDKTIVKGDFKKEANTLYNLLITPIEDQLKDKTSVCIIPNSRLSTIPFSALGYLDQANQFHFLIENYRLFYTNKMDIFSRPHKPHSIEQSFVAFGNPDKSLPGATKEVLNIQEIFPSATIFLEENATEGKAKDAIKSYSFVHFATHGILDGDDFSKSYLLFNSDEMNDGKLGVGEVNGLIKKETSMVFLSACDMAVGKEEVKGWYISPMNAFLNNRVTTAIGPLWQVPDEATQVLLTEFYKNLKYHKMSRTDALRYAQATLTRNPKYAHPYFWGAFVLYGEWR